VIDCLTKELLKLLFEQGLGMNYREMPSWNPKGMLGSCQVVCVVLCMSLLGMEACMVCGEKGLTWWSHSPAFQDKMKATVQARTTGLLSTTSCGIRKSLHRSTMFQHSCKASYVSASHVFKRRMSGLKPSVSVQLFHC
jgi:hypothetical protein